MNAFVIDLPRTYYQPVWSDPARLAPNPQPISLAWLALALALAVAGLAVAALLTTIGLTLVTSLNLAMLPCCTGLGLAVGLFYLEVTWSARV